MPAADAPSPPPRSRKPGAVDAHHHLWDPDDGGHGWLDAPELELLRRSFTPHDLRSASADGVDGRPVAATVVVQAVVDAAETRRLLATAAADPLVAGVVGWVDLTGDVSAQLDALLAAPGGELLVGVRHLVQDEPDPSWLLRDDVLRGLRALAARDLPFDLLVRAPQRTAGLEAARCVPGLRVVLDHAGKPDLRRQPPPRRSRKSGSPRGEPDLLDRRGEGWVRWAAWARELAAVEGTVCKVSGLVTEADTDWTLDDLRPAWDVLLGAFGPQRLAFGSDWPVCLLTASWQRWADTAAELAADLSAAERDALFGGTARSAYALPELAPTPALEAR